MDARSAPRTRLRVALAVVVALTSVGAAACGDDGTGAAADRATTTTAPSQGGGSESERKADGTAEVEISTTDLGDVLVDGEGYTLYVFEPDNRSAPTCVDACMDAWPPLLTDGIPKAGEGVDEEMVSTVDTGGAEQVTYDGWPLYRFAGDSEPGQTNGQGSGGVWFVIAPDGTPVEDDSGTTDGY